MAFDTWLAFAAASLALALLPGPGVAAIVGYALGSGTRVALVSVAGLAIGNVLAMSLSLAGVGAVLAASATAFTVLKFAGAAYLVGLGLWTLWRASTRSALAVDRPAIGWRTAFLGNLGVGTFHPKTIIFFVAFAPQFLSDEASYAAQAVLLIATFCGIAAVTDSLYALAAGRARHWLRTPRAARWTARASGGVLVMAGIATAAARR